MVPKDICETKESLFMGPKISNPSLMKKTVSTDITHLVSFFSNHFLGGEPIPHKAKIPKNYHGITDSAK